MRQLQYPSQQSSDGTGNNVLQSNQRYMLQQRQNNQSCSNNQIFQMQNEHNQVKTLETQNGAAVLGLQYKLDLNSQNFTSHLINQQKSGSGNSQNNINHNSQMLYAGFKGNIKSPNHKQQSSSKQSNVSQKQPLSDKRSLTETRPQIQQNKQAIQTSVGNQPVPEAQYSNLKQNKISQSSQSNKQPTPKQNQNSYSAKFQKNSLNVAQQQQQYQNFYQFQQQQQQQELAIGIMRSNSSFEKQQFQSQIQQQQIVAQQRQMTQSKAILGNANNQGYYRGIINGLNKSRDTVNNQQQFPSAQSHSSSQYQNIENYKLPQIQHQNNNAQISVKGFGSPQSSNIQKDNQRNVVSHQSANNYQNLKKSIVQSDSITANGNQILYDEVVKTGPISSTASKYNQNRRTSQVKQPNRKISQSNSSNNVALSHSHGHNQKLGDKFQTAGTSDTYNLNYDKSSRVISNKNLTSTKLSDKVVNNSAIVGNQTGVSSNRIDMIQGRSSNNGGSHPYNKRALSDDYFPDDFNERLIDEKAVPMEIGDGMLDNNDDDDFNDQNGEEMNDLMFLDNLGNGQDGYDDMEEPEEEDDDMIRDDEIVMEEDQDDDEDSSENGGKSSKNKQSNGFRTTNDNQSKTSTTAYTENNQKDFKIKKKRTQSKKRTSVKIKPKPYNEGAEENKIWIADVQANYNNDTKVITANQVVKKQIENQNGNKDQILSVITALDPEPLKQELGPDGKPLAKLKVAFLMRPPNNQVVLLKSQFGNRPPSIFFPYPSCLKLQRSFEGGMERIIKLTQEDLKPFSCLGFKINDSTHTYNCVVNSLKTAGFRLVSGSGWNILWTGLIKANKIKHVNQYQKINHFPGAWHLGRKDNLWRNVFRMKRTHGQDYNIAPQTYIFPEDYKRWCNEREMDGYKNMYIMKPTASSCGRGIKVIGKKQHINKKSGYLVSKYLSKPHLLRGFKYDMRIYVLVTCFDPLRIYLFEEGLVRLATQPYNTGKSSLSKRFIHLTNFSVNKKAQNYVPNQNQNIENAGDEAPNSSKWCMKQLRQEYQKLGLDFNGIFDKIKDVIIKTVIAVEPHIVTNMKQTKYRNACFELYGFDIILDEKLKPWLLEVNVCPSLSSSSPLDKQIKTMLLSDVLHLVGMRMYDRKKHEKEQDRINKQRLLGFESTQKKGQAPNLPLGINSNDKAPIQPNISTSAALSPTKNDRSAVVSFCNSPEKNKRIINFAEDLVDDDYEFLADLEEENSRRGHFSRIFPLSQNVDTYSKYFETQRHANNIMWNYLKLGSPVSLIKNHYK